MKREEGQELGRARRGRQVGERDNREELNGPNGRARRL